MNSGMIKTTVREIRAGLGRYLAIFAIVMLGVGLFSGLKATTPAMIKTENAYLSEQNFFDLRLLSDIGFEKGDAGQLAEMEETADAEGAVSVDALCDAGDGNESVYKFHTVPESISRIVVTAGRMPQRADECLLDSAQYGSEAIGTKITVTDNNEKDTLDMFGERTFTAVGIVRSPYYINFERGTSSVGDGKVTAFLYVPQDAFSCDYLTEIYVTAKQKYDVYTDEYEAYIDSILDGMEEKTQALALARYQRLTGDAQQEIDDAQEELDSKKAEAQEELDDAHRKIQDAQKELSDGRRELLDAQKKLSGGQQEYADGQQELREHEKELAGGRAQVRENEQKLAGAQAQLDQKKQELAVNEKKLADGKAAIAKAGQDIRSQQEGLPAREAELKEQETRLETQETELNAKKKELESQKASLEAQETELNAKKKELESQKAELSGKEEALTRQETELAEKKAELAKQEEFLKSQAASLETQESQLQSKEQELESQKAALDRQKAQLEQAYASGQADREQYGAQLAEIEAGLAKAASGKQEIEEGMQQVQAAKQQTEAGLAQTASGKQEIESGTQQLQAAKQEIEEGMQQLAAGIREIESGQEKLQDARAQVQDGLGQVADALAQLAAGKKQIKAGKGELAAGRKKLEAASAELERNRQQLLHSRKQLSQGKQQLDDAQRELESGRRELAAAKAELESGQAQLADGRRRLAKARTKLADAQKELENGRADWKKGKKELSDAKAEYADAEAEFEKETSDAQAKIEDARAELSELEKPDSYVLTRNTNIGYACYESDANIVAAIADVFPVFFFLVAALVCMTTMNRMVEEQRTQIGVLKALGYGDGAIMGKYLFYAGSAAMLGAAAGCAGGTWLFPKVIWMGYSIMYSMGDISYFFDPWLAVLSMAAALLCSAGAAYASCRHELHSAAADLIRPKAPKSGRRIFLEYVPFLWGRMKFLHKVSMRNIVRYKKRFFMMVLGIGGCTALLVTGFGIRDSVSDIAGMQYEQVQIYDIGITFANGVQKPDMEALKAGSDGRIDRISCRLEESVDLDFNGRTKSVYLEVPEDVQENSMFLNLHTQDGEPIGYPKGGEAVLSAKIAESLGIRPGDTVTLRDNSMNSFPVKISALCENFVYNYIYINRETYQSQLGKEPEFKSAFVCVTEGADIHETAAQLSGQDNVLAVSITGDMVERIRSMMGSMDYIVLLIIVCAGSLAFIVLYNLTNINITERIREIATIKVLGFYDRETADYVFRENLALTAIGALLGLGLGKGLHAFVMYQVKIDMLSFRTLILPGSCAWSLLLTFCFAMLVNGVMYFKLEKINMAESLKAVE
ncbi:MAG: FtsX-like permease family protein [Eubacterium sp.]|jgi:ABC-type lipoprotein release transport system permease subunit/predicted  nucleic acid-binding Zn-ribbon protein|nr:FtsX-like permease family protein [Eubacterium sp.]